MFCSHCGREIAESFNYCSACGSRQRPRVSYKRLTRSSSDSKIAGVCGGIAEYLDVDPTIVRVICVALSIVPGGLVGGVLAYCSLGSLFRRPTFLHPRRLALSRRSRQKQAKAAGMTKWDAAKSQQGARSSC